MTINRTRIRNVGFISTRFAGTDGVSLETEKWVKVLEAEGFCCYYFAGELDRDPEVCFLEPLAHFQHPEILDINAACFGARRRARAVTSKIQEIKHILKTALYMFLEKYDIGLMVVENALTIPVNIPLGVAVTEVIAETNMPTVAHHHDFYWERDRFAVNAVSDYLHMAFPPILPSIRHVVINSFADEQLSLRTGISARIIPNVMDFENPPPPPDDYAADVRQVLGIADDELLVLQPTRIVQRKGIEHAIELIHRLKMKAKLVISHASGDEGFDYQQRIEEYAALMKVDLVLASAIINDDRGTTPDGRKIYTLTDIYPHADLVTYPSTFEGFGNAFLEAIYFRKPILVNAYSIYLTDIKPIGFSVAEIGGYVTRGAVEKTREMMQDENYRRKITADNYALGTKFFSYDVLRRLLRSFILEYPQLFASARNWANAKR
ncbi:MAG: glycosyltransferase family 4 protein [Desulfobacterales bacterium]|jgi:glycosyltransferase involved in cell wall biosynthesis